MSRYTFSYKVGPLTRCSERNTFRSCKLLSLLLGVDRLLVSIGLMLPMFGGRLLVSRLRCFVVLTVVRGFQAPCYMDRAVL